jgi:uncharacterized beta-barrel protein YwiB (DUF1934 family)
MIPTIQIKDNFLNEKELKILTDNISKIDYQPMINKDGNLKGDELTYNGTGFYYKNNLNTYIGFVENRAIFFDGKNNMHTTLQALGPSSGRYTINIFYDNKN